ncbi:MAG: hypothetical protein ACKVJK_10505 [Methylophagaceae bacterium]|jgi:hypothetical protein|tara:strand:- start:5005 stop:5214 length:210 start_codon:yes stop_codon:yes gene_type:complete
MAYELDTRTETGEDGVNTTYVTCRIVDHPSDIYVEVPAVYNEAGELDTVTSQTNAKAAADDIAAELSEE